MQIPNTQQVSMHIPKYTASCTSVLPHHDTTHEHTLKDDLLRPGHCLKACRRLLFFTTCPCMSTLVEPDAACGMQICNEARTLW